jgi:hypothetical protein
LAKLGRMEGNASGDVPDVLGEAVLDELLVFVLVGAHVDSVVTGVRPRLVVEHHRAPCLDSYSTVRYVFRWSSVVPVEQSRIGSPRQGGREGEGETARQWPKQARGWARAGYITVPRRESPRSSLAKRVGSPRGNTMDPIKKLRRGGALSPRPLRLPPFHSPVFFNLARQNQSVPDLLASFFLP